MKQQKLDSDIKYLFKLFGIAALFAGAAILFLACEHNNIEQIKAFSSPENLPVGEAINIETLYTDSGQVRFMMKAPKLLRFDNEGTVYSEFPEGIELVKYDENKNIISSITANYAKQYAKDQLWEAKNNVIATNSQGDTLKTEHLFWDEKNKKIYSEDFVRIISPDQNLTGTGFQSDQDLKNWKIKNPQGPIYVSVEKNEPDSVKTAEPEQGSRILPPPREPLQFEKNKLP